VPDRPEKPVCPVRRRCTHDRTPNSTTSATTYSPRPPPPPRVPHLRALRAWAGPRAST
jgi:hypothetical protein